MKLRNMKTGEVKDFALVVANSSVDDTTLTELNAEWEDYEEPKEWWHIYGNQVLKSDCVGVLEDDFKEIGNYFETKEEAEKAVEFLKAIKTLKDNGIRFELNIKDYDLKIRHKRLLDDIEAKETYKALKQVAGVND